MIERFNRLLKGDEAASRRPQPSRNVYQPQPPLGFIRRTDPNFYFLTRR